MQVQLVRDRLDVVDLLVPVDAIRDEIFELQHRVVDALWVVPQLLDDGLVVLADAGKEDSAILERLQRFVDPAIEADKAPGAQLLLEMSGRRVERERGAGLRQN